MRLLPYLLALAVLGAAPAISPAAENAQPSSPASKSTAPILTPPAPETPRINGARVFGVRPGSPVLFKVPVTGRRPMTITAAGLPEGLSIDPSTGLITGTVKDPSKRTYTVKLTATNALGRAERDWRLVVGDALCLTPPMGWNSWYCWSESVDDAKIRAIARAFVDKGLIEHGWTYVNIDDCWQGARGGKYKAIMGNEKFPDMLALCDYVHARGLKVGLYDTIWMSSYGGFIGGTSPTPEGDYSAKALPPSQRPQPSQLFGRYPNALRMRMAMVGPYWFVDKDARQWAEWGVDYVKYDWRNWVIAEDEPNPERPRVIKPKSEEQLARFNKAFRDVPRDVVLSLSPEPMMAEAPLLARYANLWRITGDIKDDWKSLDRIFDMESWLPYAGPGHWNDPDMLQVGLFGVPNRQNRTLKPTRLTPDEQYTQVTLWSLLSMPLLLSCDIESLDAFTLGLITNDEVLAVDQDPLGKPARRVAKEGGLEVWAKPLEDGSLAVGLFNRTAKPATGAVRWSDLKLSGSHKVRDLWRQQDLFSFADAFEADVAPHGARLFSVR